MSFVVASAGLLVEAFYRHVRLGDRVPREGPVLVVANHTHQLVDVALALRTIDRPRTVTLAKATLFRSPLLGPLARNAHALPVHRARDGARDARAKAETQRSLDEATRTLARGGCVLLFPEGFSHDEPGIERAHTGAARIALAAVAQGARALRIVPLGLLYRAKFRPRSDVATFVGRDVPLAGVTDVDALTQHIEDALRDVTLHLEEWEDVPLIEAATTLGALTPDGPIEANVLTSLSSGIAAMRAREPRELALLRRRVSVHARRLRRIGIRPDEIKRRHVVVAALRQLGRTLLAPFARDRGARLRAAAEFVRLLVTGRLHAHVDDERRALVDDIQRLLTFVEPRGLSPGE